MGPATCAMQAEPQLIPANTTCGRVQGIDARFALKPEIAISTPAAQKLKVVRSPSKSRPVIPAGSPSFVARSDRLHAPSQAPLTTRQGRAGYVLGFINVFNFRP
eukprot:2948641-Prymnesium_polylepis.2